MIRNEKLNINIFNYDESYDKPQVICLGFFDCIHLGHLKLFNKAKLLSHLNNLEISCFTFENNPLSYFSDQKLVYTFEERIVLFSSLNINNVFKAYFDDKFLSLNKEDFLNNLCMNKNIKAIVCGEDYTFGYKKEGNVDYLKKYCINNNIELYIEDLKLSNNKKISSKSIRNMLIDGEIEEANKLLISPYSASGKVISGKGIGSKKIYPTINIQLNQEKVIIKPGVYYTLTCIDGVSFKSVTNVGTKPTLNDYSKNIETYILFYNKDLYNKEITIKFIKRIRDIAKFNTIDELKNQISKDIDYVLTI